MVQWIRRRTSHPYVPHIPALNLAGKLILFQKRFVMCVFVRKLAVSCRVSVVRIVCCVCICYRALQHSTQLFLFFENHTKTVFEIMKVEYCSKQIPVVDIFVIQKSDMTVTSSVSSMQVDTIFTQNILCKENGLFIVFHLWLK